MLIVSAHPFCASLPSTQIHMPRCHKTHAVGQRDIAIALPGYNYLGRSVTSTLILMAPFLYRFSRSSAKMKTVFCKMHHRSYYM